MIEKLKSEWVDTPEHHKRIKEEFEQAVNNNPELKEHRDFVEKHAFGFGERSFTEMWRILVDEMPTKFDFLEIGIFRGAILSLIPLLARKANKEVLCYGISPLDSTEGYWESLYKKDIQTIHEQFELQLAYSIYQDVSTAPEAIEFAEMIAPYDLIYIDGGHTYEVVKSDLENYAPLVKVGGYLVMDDSCQNMDMPFGFFQGIEDVTRATLEWEENNNDFEFQFNVVHNKVFKRIK